MNADIFLENNGLLIEDTKEYALNKENALYYIKLLNLENKIILGGDVYLQDISTGDLLPTYDNWYIDTKINNSNNGYEYTKKYIEKYNSNEFIYFVIVVK